MPRRASRPRRTQAVIAGRADELRSLRAKQGYPITYAQLATDLGMSESSLYKIRKGTRSGSKIYDRLRRENDIYQVIVETGGGGRKSVNVFVEPEDLRRAGIRRTFSEPKIAVHPQTQRLVREELARQAAKSRREKKGSAPWTRKQIQSARVLTARRPVRPRTPAHELKLTMPFPVRRGE